MFNKHLLKVIIGFCGMITLGLVSLVIIDSFKLKNQEPAQAVTSFPPQQIPQPEVKPKPPIKKSAPAKTPTTKPVQR